MASSSSTPEPSPSDILPWLKALPVAPEYRPTLAEFQDPISYILKIEPEASRYGICKIIPPLPPPPKKTSVANLNRSFAARDPHPKKPPTFSTRHQRVGFCPRSPRPALRHVWQSSDHYTLQQFEAKAKQFEKSQLKKAGKKGTATPIEIETLFWKASADKPFSVEYANDMPGSGFAPTGGAGTGRRWRRAEDAADVGETAWNMHGVSRAQGSLLRFMREDIPGVTSPMVYVAMMFSWFAWHVEDHDLHSLNYLDLGASKTWYGVPRDAALAFEEVVRVHGYNGEVNPLATFAILREKTTVMSPEVLIGAGIPCCRLVQNAGEFVVTFPGAYHSGFSHGFNCGEAANIATPEWLRVAKEAAIRRASTNYPPMVSHFQLLYALALSLCSRVPMSCNIEPRSSRLKDKMKGEGEIIVKKKFVENVIENNNLLSVLLDKGSSCIILPQNTSESLCSSSHVRSQVKVKPRLSFDLCSRQEALEGSKILLSDNVILDGDVDTRHSYDFCSMEGNAALVCQEKKPYLAMCGKFGTYDFFSSTLESQNVETEKERTLQGEGILDQGLLSCVTCGILSFACVAVIQPREAAARYLMSTDCSLFNDNIVGSMEINNTGNIKNWKTSHYDPASASGPIKMHPEDRVDDNLAHCSGHSVQVSDRSVEVVSGIATQGRISALDLLASAYGDSSDSEETEPQHEISVDTDENDFRDSSLSGNVSGQLRFTRDAENFCSSKPLPEPTEDLNGTDCQDEETLTFMKNSSEFVSSSGVTSQDSDDLLGLTSANDEERCQLKSEFSVGKQAESPRIVVADRGEDDREIITSSSILKSMREHESDVSFRLLDSDCCATGIGNACLSDLKGGNLRSSLVDCSMRFDSCSDSAAQTENASMTMQLRDSSTKTNGITIADMQRSDKDSSRMHVFCLEHAVEVEKRLHPMGDVHVMLLCHPDYPKIEAEAKMVAQELGFDYTWKDIPFKEATKEDQERIRSALEDEEAIPTNSDWTVKLGINLYYSASLSKSPLYSKQMPYNTIIYRAFGCNSPANSPIKLKATGRRPARHKKIVVAGRWCGKVWMSNQVHPYLAHRNEAQERDDSEKLYSQVSDKKPKVESDIEHTDQPKSVTIKATRKSNRKRKMPSRKVNNKKLRGSQVDSSPRGKEDVAENPIQSGRVLRSCRLKHATTPLRKLNQKDEAEGGPSTRLRSRPSKFEVVKARPTFEKKIRKSKAKKALASSLLPNGDELLYPCDVEGCPMGFSTKHDLALHKRNICPVKGCGKKFFSHKYLVQHRKVHLDDRPLKCPWKGCKMTFKWAWARTEHIRVHTGDRPYVCRECSQTFRFVSDFSRHKRKTGHSTKKGRR